jgi:hypothetical protein
MLKPSSCWWHPLEFLRSGWARVLPLHALFFGFWIELMDQCFILNYDPVDKISAQPSSETKYILKCQA